MNSFALSRTVITSMGLVILLCACSAGESAQDARLPRISETIPPNGATGIAVDTAISAVFSTAMDPLSITTKTFMLAGPTTEVAGVVSFDGVAASFSPATNLAYNTTYTATITGTVGDVAGNTLGKDYVWSFTTIARERAWGTPILVENLSGDASDTQVAIDHEGNGMAVWVQQSDGGIPGLWYNRYVVNKGWEGASQIEMHISVVPKLPQIAIDGSGNIFVLWEESTELGSFSMVSAKRYESATGQWGATQTLLDVGVTRYVSRNPKLAVDRNGNALVVWEDDTGLGVLGVYVSRYDRTIGSWSGKELLGEFGSDPQIVVDGSGNAIAVWAAEDLCFCAIFARRYDEATGLWGSIERLSNEGNFSIVAPRVTVSPGGDAIVVWLQADRIISPPEFGIVPPALSPYRVWANRFDTSVSHWDMPQLIWSDTVGALDPQVGSDDAGNAIVAWSLTGGPGRVVRYVKGSGWGEPEFNSAVTAGLSYQLAVDGQGNAVVVGSIYAISWGGPILAVIQATHYQVGVGWSPTLVISGSDGVAGGPHVAVNGSGQALVVWLQREVGDTGPSSVWANRFE